jgi:FkbM family methyltransferase
VRYQHLFLLVCVLPYLELVSSGARSMHFYAKDAKPALATATPCFKLLVALLTCIVFSNVLMLFSAYRVYSSASSYLSLPPADFLNAVQDTSVGRSVVRKLKEGLLRDVLQEQARLFSISVPLRDGTDRAVQFAGVDTSQNREPFLIIRRLSELRGKLQTPAILPFAEHVLDIGANDGILSSNSRFFLQLGWNATLVEPLKDQLELALSNNMYASDPNGDSSRGVLCGIQAAISANGEDGTARLELSDDRSSMESRLLYDTDSDSSPGSASSSAASGRSNSRHSRRRSWESIEVRTVSLPTLKRECRVPNKIALLSIDVEGLGAEVLLHALQHLQPAYIIFELIHHDDDVVKELLLQLRSRGYRVLSRVGWNAIFELDGWWRRT